MSWQDFKAGYSEHLERPDALETVYSLIDLVRDSLVTVLCVEKDATKCHRRLLAQKCLAPENPEKSNKLLSEFRGAMVKTSNPRIERIIY